MQRLVEHQRQYRHPVLLPLAATHDDLGVIEIDILDSQPQSLEQAQTATVKKLPNEMEFVIEVRQ